MRTNLNKNGFYFRTRNKNILSFKVVKEALSPNLFLAPNSWPIIFYHEENANDETIEFYIRALRVDRRSVYDVDLQ